MKQSLALRVGQNFTMTPQLQQAIRLMQLSTLELKLEVRQAIESNPMLDLVEDDDADGADDEDLDEAADAEPEADADEEPSAEDDDEDALDADSEDVAIESLDAIPEDLPVDVDWDDIYTPAGVESSSGAAADDGVETRHSTAESLADHLLWQLNLTPMSDRDRLAALAIVDGVDEDGMLAVGIAELVDALPAELGFEVAEVEAVLKLVQRFDPPGVAARDLAECLRLQLEQLPDDTFWRTEAIAIVRDHFALLAKREYATLERRARLSADELTEVVQLIRSLNPRPGAALGAASVDYVEPDVVVAKKNGRWTVELNLEAAPRVRVNNLYAGFIRRADSSPENQYLKDNLQDAKWFMKNLEYRNETLLRVAAQIVERQRDFLEHGEEAMKPLVLADIADAVERHESTISRVTTRKYMATPRGIFELKYFFSSHVATVAGGEVSSTAIRALIKKLVGEEPPRTPLSDQRLADILKERGIAVARRTIAKYRESLAIPSSNDRRRLV